MTGGAEVTGLQGGGEGADFGMRELQEILRSFQGDDASALEQDDAGGEEQGLAQIVGDKDDGFAETPGERGKLALQLGAGDGVQRAKGLIHEQDGRVRGEGARHTDALTLATRKLAGIAGGEILAGETDELQQLGDAGGDTRSVPMLEGGDKSDVLRDGEVREQSSFLNDVADAAAQVKGIPCGGGASLDQDGSGGGREHAIDEPEQGGLAAAAAAEEHHGFAGGDGQRDVGYKYARVRGTTGALGAARGERLARLAH